MSEQSTHAINGKRIAVIILISFLAAIMLAVGVLFGVISCTNKGPDGGELNFTHTLRGEVPTDGSKPTDHTGIENIGYLATVFDSQAVSHSYAYNSTKASGYEQITRSWKDYMSAEANGTAYKIMIASDLSYSAFVKSATQTCFASTDSFGRDGSDFAAYMRIGDRPKSKESEPSDINWPASKPTYFNYKDYLETYGEPSTELSVYALNDETVDSCSDVTDNGDGTYSQTFYLNANAACWYQYGMKTRGGLKFFPEYEKIEITFTFDANWKVLQTYCVEKVTIAPKSLGGIPMSSTSATTTTFTYGEVDGDHFAQFENYYKEYVGQVLDNNTSDGSDGIDIVDVLGSGFSKVMEEDGQNFDLGVKMGGTEYKGKISAKLDLDKLDNILDALEVRISLGKEEGQQDLFIEFSEGVLDVYYSSDFALTADINEITEIVKSITQWINSFDEEENSGSDTYSLTRASLRSVTDDKVETKEGDDPLTALLTMLSEGFVYDENSASISLKTDDLLGLGIAIDATINFTRSIDAEGDAVYDFSDLVLRELKFNSTTILSEGGMVPSDDMEEVTRKEDQTPFDLAEFLTGVEGFLRSKTYVLNLDIDGAGLLQGLELSSTIKLMQQKGFKQLFVSVPLKVSYKGISVTLDAFYTVNTTDGSYGEVYLYISEICGKEVNLKVHSDINDTVDAVKELIALFTDGENTPSDDTEENGEQTGTDIVSLVIGAVLKLDFEKLITGLKSDSQSLTVGINIDEILSAFEVKLGDGVEIGELVLTLNNAIEDETISLSASLKNLGVSATLYGSSEGISAPNDADKYLDATELIESIYGLISSKTYVLDLDIEGVEESLLEGLTVDATVKLMHEDKYNKLTVVLPLYINYDGISITLEAYYSIDLTSGTYGEIYLCISEICGIQTDIKVYSDIKDTVDAVKQIIELFADGDDDDNNSSADGNEDKTETDIVAKIIDAVLTLDFKKVLSELKAHESGLTVGLNIDEIVKVFKEDFEGAGELSLTLAIGESATLSATLAKLGVSATIYGSDETLSAPEDAEDYFDVTELINSVYELINSNTYVLDLDINGVEESLLEGLTVDVTVKLMHEDKYNKLTVVLPLYVEYDGISITLEAYYSIDLTSGTYGEIYLYISEICGIEADIKVYSNITDTVEAVKRIIELFDDGDDGEGDGDGSSDGTKEDEEQPETDIVAEIINAVLSLDYTKVFTELKANSEGLKVSIDIDEIVKVFKEDFEGVGELNLALAIGESATLSATLEDLGVSVNIYGSDEALSAPEDANDYFDATEYIIGIYNLINSKTYILNLDINGVEDSLLEGLTVDATVKLMHEDKYNKLTVVLPLYVQYEEISITLEAFYTIDLTDGSYGEIYLYISEICGETVSIKVYCDIYDTVEAVKELIAMFGDDDGDGNVEDNGDGSSDGTKEDEEQPETDIVTDIINAVLGLDFTKVVTELKANSEGLKVSIDIDEIVKAFKEDFEGVGELVLTLKNVEKEIDEEQTINVATLSATLSTLGVSATISGSDEILSAPEDEKNYIDIYEFIQTVKQAIVEAQAIIGSEDIEFSIDGVLTVDGIKISVNGNGEVIWKNGDIIVAIDATFAIAENESGEKVNVKLVYDQTNDTFVRFAVGNPDGESELLGFAITDADIGVVTDLVDRVITAVQSLIGNSAQPTALDGTGIEIPGTEDGEDKEEEQTNSSAINYVQILKTVLKLVNNVTVSLQDTDVEGEVKDILITYARYGSLVLSANGGLSLELNIANDDKTEILALNASVCAGDGDMVKAINARLDKAEYNTEDGFIRATYLYVLSLLDNFSVKDILANRTFVVDVVIDGNNSEISALVGIYAEAHLYYSEPATAEGEDAKDTKLVEADIKLNIKGTEVELKAYYQAHTVYISLDNINGTVLNDIAFKVETENLYDAAKTLVTIITSDTLAQIVSAVLGEKHSPVSLDADNADGNNDGNDGNEGGDGEPLEGESSKALEDILAYLLSLDFNEVISLKKVDGKNVLTVNPDGILQYFGVDVTVGEIKVSFNPENHSIGASVACKEDAWLTLKAEAVKNSPNSKLPEKEFIDIGFISTLLEDLLVTLDGTRSEEGDTDLRYSFTGNVSVAVSISIINVTVNIEDTVVTLGVDEDDDFYFTFYGHLKQAKINLGSGGLGSLLGGLVGNLFSLTQDRYISVTYSNGYITFGINVNSNPQYRIMTTAYLIDNLLDNIYWLIGTDGNVQNIINSATKDALSGLSSGLTKSETLYLYELAEAAQGEGIFSLASVLNSFVANIGGKSTNYKLSDAALSQLELEKADNYYAFDLNGYGLTDGLIPTLYAAVLRDGEKGGISGLKAYLTVASMLKVRLNLDSVTKDHKQNYFKTADGQTIVKGYTDPPKSEWPEHTTPRFGMYDSSEDKPYKSSYVLDTVTLNVVDENDVMRSYKLTYGSTVYLLSPFAPDWTDENRQYIYVYQDAQGELLGEFIVLDDTILSAENNFTIYEIKKIQGKTQMKEIIYHIEIDGIGDVSAAFPVKADGSVTIAEYEVKNYVLVGMYRDANHENAIAKEEYEAFNGTEIYCKYVAERVEINGVVYSFDATIEEGAYYVSGKTENIVYNSEEWLILENEINGYPVKYIGQAAFANTDEDNTARSLVNVIVPENIIAVYENAFLDNKGLRNVVFLADEVFFGGTVSHEVLSDDIKTTVFYGCYVNGNDITNNKHNKFTVYYKALGQNPFSHVSSSTSVGNWTAIYYSYALFGSTTYHVNTQTDGWAYVNYEINIVNNVNGIDVREVSFPELLNGVNFKTMSQEEIKEYVINTLNAATQGKGYINAFEVEVSGGFDLNGKMNTVNITITEKPENEWCYRLTVESTVAQLIPQVQYTSGAFEEFRDAVYVKAGTAVAVKVEGDDVFTFDGWTSSNINLVLENNTEETSFAMPVGETTLTANWDANYAENIYVYSEVKFTYSGVEYDPNGVESEPYVVELTNAAVNRELEKPKADGYYFLGWAQVSEGNTLQTADTLIKEDTEATFYALWAVARQDVTFTLDGATVSATPTEGAVYGWYNRTDDKFTGGELALGNTYTLSKDVTVVRVRLQYSLTVNLNAGTTNWYYSQADGDTINDISNSRGNVSGGKQIGSDNCQFNDIIPIIEGYKVEIYRYWTDALVIKIYNGNACVTTYLIKAWKSKSSYDKRNLGYDSGHYFAFNSGEWIVSDEVKPEGSDGGIYYRNGNSDTKNDRQLFGTAENVAGNLEITCTA